MQLVLNLTGQSIRLPVAYRRILQGLLYHGAESEYSAFLHDSGYQAAKRRYKLFTFGPLSGSYELHGHEIVFRDTVRWEVRSVDARLIQLLLRAFQPGADLRLGENRVTVRDCVLEDRRIFEPQCTVRTLAPITVYLTTPEGRTEPFSPEDPRFAQAVAVNACRKWQSWTGDSTPPAFSFRVRQDTPYRKEVTTYQGTYITGWSGLFTLEGPPAMLDLLYNTGLGAKNAQGFGMFEII